MANVLETIRTRSSIRAYSSEKLTEEQVKSLTPTILKRM